MENINLNNKYSIVKKISQGAFGEIYKGLDKNNKQEVIIKLEFNSTQPQLLHYEAKILEYLNKENNNIKIPRVIYYDSKGDFNFMVMNYLGNTWEDILKISIKFNIFFVSQIAIQLIKTIKEIHDLYIIHRDLKPENILFDLDKNKENWIYIIDFGLSKKYINSKMKHISYAKNMGFRGTFRFASIYMHEGIQSSRRDDLESIIYILIYLIKGKLPWQYLENKNDDLNKIIGNLKKNISIDVLFEDIPVIFKEFYKKVRKLRFDEEPKYEDYILCFSKYIKENNFQQKLSVNNLINNNIKINLKNVENQSQGLKNSINKNEIKNEKIIENEPIKKIENKIKSKGFKRPIKPKEKINKIELLEEELLNLKIPKGPIVNNYN